MIGASIIDRYVFREIVGAFVFCFTIFLMTGLVGGFLPLLQTGMEHGMKLTMILFQLLINTLPSTLVTVLPLSMMIGILLGLGRLSADNEIAAMKSAGISIVRLLPPVAFLGLLGFGISLWCTLSLIPAGVGEGRRLMKEAIPSALAAGIEERNFNDTLPGLILYVETMEPKTGTMTNIFLRHTPMSEKEAAGRMKKARGEGGALDRKANVRKEISTIVAKKGEVTTDPKGKNLILHLWDGTMITEGPDGFARGTVEFKTTVFRYSLARALPKDQGKSLEEMSISEIVTKMESLDTQGQDLSPAVERLHRRVRNLGRIQITQRLVLPLASLVLALLAFPLGVLSMGGSRLNNVSVGLVAIFFYYAASLSVERAARSALAPPEIVLSLPPLLFLLLAAYFIRCVRLERVPWVVRAVMGLVFRLRRTRSA